MVVVCGDLSASATAVRTAWDTASSPSSPSHRTWVAPNTRRGVELAFEAAGGAEVQTKAVAWDGPPPSHRAKWTFPVGITDNLRATSHEKHEQP